MSKEEAIEVSATVLETLPNVMLKVVYDDIKHEVLAHVSGKSGKNLSVLIVDKVFTELLSYGLKLGRITYRYK